MDKQSKVLLIDNSPDRKKRISLLKSNGFAVYPALNLEEARSRCKPGAYDLIVVNVGDQRDMAVEFCDALSQRSPKQHVLMAGNSDFSGTNREYVASDDPEQLLERVKKLLGVQAPSGDYASAA